VWVRCVCGVDQRAVSHNAFTLCTQREHSCTRQSEKCVLKVRSRRSKLPEIPRSGRSCPQAQPGFHSPTYCGRCFLGLAARVVYLLSLSETRGLLTPHSMARSGCESSRNGKLPHPSITILSRSYYCAGSLPSYHDALLKTCGYSESRKRISTILSAVRPSQRLGTRPTFVLPARISRAASRILAGS
jgi:hypothetical protein